MLCKKKGNNNSKKLFVVGSFIVCFIFLLLPEHLNREAQSRVDAFFEQQRALLETNKKTVSYGQVTYNLINGQTTIHNFNIDDTLVKEIIVKRVKTGRSGHIEIYANGLSHNKEMLPKGVMDPDSQLAKLQAMGLSSLGSMIIWDETADITLNLELSMDDQFRLTMGVKMANAKELIGQINGNLKGVTNLPDLSDPFGQDAALKKAHLKIADFGLKETLLKELTQRNPQLAGTDLHDELTRLATLFLPSSISEHQRLLVPLEKFIQSPHSQLTATLTPKTPLNINLRQTFSPQDWLQMLSLDWVQLK